MLRSAGFTPRPVVRPEAVPVAQRLVDCPTIKSFAPHWAGLQTLQTPSERELRVYGYTAANGADAGASSAALASLGEQARGLIDARLQDTGSLLLQGLPIDNAERVEAFVQGLGFSRMTYEPYGGVRAKIGALDAATNVGHNQLLDLHNEMAYNPHPAAKILLICLKPAAEGGESLVGDGAAITEALPAPLLARFEAKGGVRYTRIYRSADASPPPVSEPQPMTWQDRTGLSEPEAAAAFFTALGFDVSWQPGDTMHAVFTAPAVVPHPATGQPLWFNNVHLSHPGFPGVFPCTYGDGAPIEPETVAAVNAARLAATRVMKLDVGDVLVLDNYRYLHGRLPYTGGERVLVAVLTSD